MDSLIKMASDKRQEGLIKIWKEMDLEAKRFWIKLFCRSLKLYPDRIEIEHPPQITFDNRHKMTLPVLSKKLLNTLIKEKKAVLLAGKKKLDKMTVIDDEILKVLRKKHPEVAIKITKLTSEARAGLS